MLAHSFYMPVVVSGPIIRSNKRVQAFKFSSLHFLFTRHRFKEFNDGLEAKYEPWTLKRVLSFALLLARFSFWWMVAELILHFFYFSVMR